MATIELANISKVFPGGSVALRDLNLTVAEGELLVVLGPSGSGKSTTLRLVAGLESPSSGRILIDGRDVTRVAPRHRDLAMVFQDQVLYPHKTARQNLEFGLRLRKTDPATIASRVEHAASALQLEGLLDRLPSQLSGGQRQRVALGRAIVREPKAFLLDEPLSSLDPPLRMELRGELARLHRRLGATMLYVTHDQEEAMTLGQRVAVLCAGRLEQIGPPEEIYRWPANRFVAGFVGAPPMNFFRGRILRTDRGATFQCPWFELANLPGAAEANEQDAELGIRPQALRISGAGEGDVVVRVEVVQSLGSERLVDVVLTSGQQHARATLVLPPSTTAVKVDDVVGLEMPRDEIHLFAVPGGRRLHCKAGNC